MAMKTLDKHKIVLDRAKKLVKESELHDSLDNYLGRRIKLMTPEQRTEVEPVFKKIYEEAIEDSKAADKAVGEFRKCTKNKGYEKMSLSEIAEYIQALDDIMPKYEKSHREAFNKFMKFLKDKGYVKGEIPNEE